MRIHSIMVGRFESRQHPVYQIFKYLVHSMQPLPAFYTVREDIFSEVGGPPLPPDSVGFMRAPSHTLDRDEPCVIWQQEEDLLDFFLGNYLMFADEYSAEVHQLYS